DRAIAVQVNNVFEIGVDCDAFQLKIKLLLVLVGCARILRGGWYVHAVTVTTVMVISTRLSLASPRRVTESYRYRS
ncbi:MAG: hypothetical protein ACKO4M_08890, partial [Betaproteobacteria bacterium]